MEKRLGSRTFRFARRKDAVDLICTAGAVQKQSENILNAIVV